MHRVARRGAAARARATLACGVLAGAILAAAGCGSDDVSSADARRIVVSGLLDGGRTPDVADCVADTALERHDPGELVNTAGVTSDAVNASVAAIVADCEDEFGATVAPPSANPTSVPSTTEAPVLDSGYCNASGDVLVALDAAPMMDRPGPAAYEAWVGEALGRTELAILTAPDGRLRDIHVVLHGELEQLDRHAAELGYDPGAFDAEASARADAIGARIEAQRVLLADVVASGCELTLAGAAEQLAGDLVALDAAATTVPATSAPGTVAGDVAVDHRASGIELRVPAAWSREEGSGATLAAPRYLVRAVDLATFNAAGLHGEGVRIEARDGTVDYQSALAASPVAAACALDREEPYDDGVYVGVQRYYRDCGGSAPWIVLVGAADNSGEVAVYVEIRVAADTHPAIDMVLATFYV